TMADVNVNAPAEQAPAMAPPTRTDDQILPRSSWVPTSTFERPRAPVLQILWGVVNRAHIDYAERMWEEFTQSIHSFVEDKKNLALHTHRNKKANPLVIPSVSFWDAYQIYLVGEEVSDPGSPAPKPAKATKPKATKQSKPLAPKAAPESSEAPSLAKRPKACKVIKKRKPKISLQLIDEFVDKGVPDKEPVYGDEEADMQRAIEESLKEVHDAHWGPLPPVVIREPDSRKFQPLPNVQGKGKENVNDEQMALDLLTIQTPKKKSPAEQYIFQRHKFDKEVPRINVGDQDEGQAGLNPGIQDEGQARSNPGDAAVSQPQSSHAIHVGPNREHVDFEVIDTLIQQNLEQMDEEFTTTTYPNVQENLKLPTEDQVRLEEPASSARTLSSLLNLNKELSFADQFLVEKSQEDEPKKTNTESEVQSMVTVPIHQDTSSVPLMTTLVIDLTVSQPVSIIVQAPLPTSTATVIAITTTTFLPLPPP
ncbi:retrovirus-related pol polyprotein from transposon TNT 1-94, partial [Tanacetum coccineum]